ncbi:MAG: metal-sensing transcriptional repressor [Erysipelotrichaceae bacterium]|jgi:CsoR family transcriptional regulator, copper-sensing transcriptional repressor|nr:metal-sensing transcriptional repressor [Erysipelotrichaceae bacterium]
MIKISSEVRGSLKKRLNRINGQINGIGKMIDDERKCEDILIQIAAANNALKSLSQELLRNHMETCMKDEILNGKDESISEVIDLIKKI